MASLISSPRIHLRLIAVWLILSVAGITAAVIAWEHLGEVLSTSSANRIFRHAMEDLFDTLQDAESAERGYLLTAQDRYLAVIAQSERMLPLKIDQLVELSGDDKETFRDILELRHLAEARLQEIRRTVTVYQKQGERAAKERVQTGDGNQIMEQTRQLLSRLDATLKSQGAVRDAKTSAELGKAILITVLAGIMGLSAAILAIYLSQKAIKQEHNLKGIAEELARSQRSADQKSTFLANMSHEIRTPMTAILGFSDLLASDLPAGSRTANYSRSIRESSLSLIHLINDILDVTRMDVGMVVLHPEPVDLPDVLDFVATIFSQQMALKSLDFQITHGPGIPRALMLDRSRVRQALINLVGNALKFTERGSVGLHAEWEPDYTDRTKGTLVFEVSDTGVGIPADRQATIFEPFVQVSHRSRGHDGSGLGLSIVKRLVEVMGGSVALQKSGPTGSLFKVRIPDVAISARLASQPSDGGRKVHFDDLAPSEILVIDDHSVNRELLGEVFRSSHHRVTVANGPAEALQKVRERRPNLILMDVRAPSAEVARTVHALHAIAGCETLPIVALTATALPGERGSLESVFSGFIAKPYTRHSLYQELASFLPAHVDPGAAVEEDALDHSPISREDGAERWPQLLYLLHDLETSRWPAVRESGAINETKDFAGHLADLGRSARCPPLISYADLLRRDAESFAVTRLEQRLNEFPDVILAIARETGTLA